MRDGRLDVIITGGATPAGAIVELGSVQEIAFVPLSKELAEHVAKELGVKLGVIPANSYSFQKEDLYVPFTSFIIVAGPTATFDDAYKLAKAMYEQMERYRSLHPALSLASRERLPDVGSLKLHPGAEAFYRDFGLIECSDVESLSPVLHAQRAVVAPKGEAQPPRCTGASKKL
ncbi:hypothetical protein D3C85_1188280 [compost metagenome]